jgi:hypothetical protein
MTTRSRSSMRSSTERRRCRVLIGALSRRYGSMGRARRSSGGVGPTVTFNTVMIGYRYGLDTSFAADCAMRRCRWSVRLRAFAVASVPAFRRAAPTGVPVRGPGGVLCAGVRSRLRSRLSSRNSRTDYCIICHKHNSSSTRSVFNETCNVWRDAPACTDHCEC